jgi:hypothetical protein
MRRQPNSIPRNARGQVIAPAEGKVKALEEQRRVIKAELTKLR